MPITIRLSIVLFFSSSLIPGLNAQTTGGDTEAVYELEEFIVTGTAFPVRQFDAVSDVISISNPEKERLQAANLGDTLESLPGITNIQTGTGAGKPVIRGLSGNRIRVLQDSVGVNYQQWGVRHPPNIDPFLAGRIEIVRGVSSILYGSDAFGGAINVLSPEINYTGDDSNYTSGELTYGYESGHDLHTYAGGFSYVEENWGIIGGIVHRNAGLLEVPNVETWAGPPPTGQASDVPLFDDELDFTDYEQLNGNIKFGYHFGAAEASIRYERWDHENNYLLVSTPPVGTFNPTGIGVELENNLIQAELISDSDSDWNWQTSYTWNQNLRRANRGGAAAIPLPVQDPEDIDLERNSHVLRAEFMRGDSSSRYSGRMGIEGLYEDQESRGLTGLTPGGQIENLALFGLGRLHEGPWTVEAGLRYDHRKQEADPSQTDDANLLVNRVDPVTLAPVDVNLENTYDVVTASLGILYEVNDSLDLAVNFSRGFRAPELFELYAGGIHGGVAAYQFGETSLDEETSLGADFQARWRSERFEVVATTYLTDFSDYIYLENTGNLSNTALGIPPTLVYRVDQADATLYGGDLSAKFRATNWLRLEGSYEIARGDFENGDDLPLLPADQFHLVAIFMRDALGPVEDLEFRIGLRHVFSKDAAGRLEPFSQFDSNPNFGTASTDAYTLLDLGLSARWKNINASLKVENVTDEDYRDFLDTYKGYALSPGRSIIFQTSVYF